MNEHLNILKLVVERLEQANIAYMISGSIAMNYYAQPRMTRDIDIVVELILDDVERVTALFMQDFYIDELEERLYVLANNRLYVSELD